MSDLLTDVEKAEAIMAKWAEEKTAKKKKDEAAKAAIESKNEGALVAGTRAGRGLGIGTRKQLKGLEEEGY